MRAHMVPDRLASLSRRGRKTPQIEFQEVSPAETRTVGRLRVHWI